MSDDQNNGQNKHKVKIIDTLTDANDQVWRRERTYALDADPGPGPDATPEQRASWLAAGALGWPGEMLSVSAAGTHYGYDVYRVERSSEPDAPAWVIPAYGIIAGPGKFDTAEAMGAYLDSRSHKPNITPTA